MPQDQRAWTFEHSIDCRVSAEFAWAFWTNVRNWALDADVESIEIDGPFAAVRGESQTARVPDASNGYSPKFSPEVR